MGLHLQMWCWITSVGEMRIAAEVYMRLQDSDLKVFSRNLNPECSGLWQVDSSWQVDSWMCQYKWRIRMFRFS
jgi:hypothetical protein